MSAPACALLALGVAAFGAARVTLEPVDAMRTGTPADADLQGQGPVRVDQHRSPGISEDDVDLVSCGSLDGRSVAGALRHLLATVVSEL
jgi:hypothetical protein